jgi:hypothetical protein
MKYKANPIFSLLVIVLYNLVIFFLILSRLRPMAAQAPSDQFTLVLNGLAATA